MGEEVQRDRLDEDVMDKISERLSNLADLHLPYAMRTREEPVSPLEVKDLLAALLSRDPAIFLERYGSKLKTEELQEFEVLKDDYAVNWHLRHLKSILNPTIEEKRLHAVTAKNRRLAYMERLIHDGQYFSEDAMRERAPLLHHEYVGRFQDPNSRGFSRPGERWSETLMRQSEEARIVQQIKEEQERLGIEEEETDEEEEGGNEEEEEEEEEEDDSTSNEEMTKNDKHANGDENGAVHQENMSPSERLVSDARHSKKTISDEEVEMKMEHFTRIMQEKFLSGDDTEHVDYAYIDNNVSLDDHWLREITQDAEEKYFEDDD